MSGRSYLEHHCSRISNGSMDKGRSMRYLLVERKWHLIILRLTSKSRIYYVIALIENFKALHCTALHCTALHWMKCLVSNFAVQVLQRFEVLCYVVLSYLVLRSSQLYQAWKSWSKLSCSTTCRAIYGHTRHRAFVSFVIKARDRNGSTNTNSNDKRQLAKYVYDIIMILVLFSFLPSLLILIFLLTCVA